MRMSLIIVLLGLMTQTIITAKNPGSRQFFFTENKGQFRDQYGKPNPEVLYMADFGGMKVQLRKTGFSYETYQVKPKWFDPLNN